MDTMALEEELTRFSLVSINGVAQATVHRLVQRVIRHQLLALTSCRLLQSRFYFLCVCVCFPTTEIFFHFFFLHVVITFS
jgi:hypothetical protein